jgi:hypothetical protein
VKIIHKGEFAGLPVRVANCVRWGCEAESKEELRQKLATEYVDLDEVPNVGRVNKAIILAWLDNESIEIITRYRWLRKCPESIAGMISDAA